MSIATAMTNLGHKVTPEEVYRKIKMANALLYNYPARCINSALRGTDLELSVIKAMSLSEELKFDLRFDNAQILARIIDSGSVFRTNKIEFVTITKLVRKKDNSLAYSIIDHNYDPNKDYGDGFISVPAHKCVVADIPAFAKDTENGALYYVIAKRDAKGGDFV